MNIKLFFVVFSLFVLSFVTGCQCFVSAPTRVYAKEVSLDPLFTDHMVLQRNRIIKIRGWSEPGGIVKISLAGSDIEATADSDGEWIAQFPPMKAGGPYKLIVQSALTVEAVDDILIGDVWICSGQSNMAFTVRRAVNSDNEIKNAEYPDIRFFKVNRAVSPVPMGKLLSSSGWNVCSPDTVAQFSAVGYFFGRELNRKLNIPIGLINTSWGGTVAEAWTSLEMLRTLPSFDKRISAMPGMDKISIAAQKKKNKEFSRIVALRNKEIKKLYEIEADKEYAEKMSAPELNDSDWKTMKVPIIWEKAGLPDFDGVVIFRKTIDIPPSWEGRELKLALSPIDEVDVTYFNGVKIGGKGSCRKNIVKYWNQPRLYTVPGNLVKAGKNVITSLVYDLCGAGGLAGGESEDMKAFISASPDNFISLSGLWKYKPGFRVRSLPPGMKQSNQNSPAFLFNAMINPLLEFPIAGAVWYQGESNAGRAFQYQRLFPAMIQDWRIRWRQGDFPFYFVQLANYMAVKKEPGESAWAELREAQTMALRLPNTGMAVIIDIGEAEDIHPKNKQDVGKRLAQNALFKYYKKIKTVPAGPLYEKVKFSDGKAILTFRNTGKGLLAEGGVLKGFTVAGDDKKFVPAKAEITDDKVIVWSDKIGKPVAVRYAWADNPECNLYNKDRFPASPFRTDKWSGITEKNK